MTVEADGGAGAAGELAASPIGAPHTLMVGGVCCLLGALWFARALPAIRDAVRPLYVKLGILPPYQLGTEEGTADATPGCHTDAHLIGSDWKDRTLMAIMALSMGYMFYGMQLLH